MASALQTLLNDVYARATDDAADRYRALVAVLKENHYWPALQVKHFFDHSGLTLLHNTYTRTDVDDFRELYDECRSVVLDLSQPADANIVVSLANSIPQRMTDVQYTEAAEEADVVERSYDGTVISVYHHAGVWHFGTSTCPIIDRSRFAHPTKTHGAMFDEAIKMATAEPKPARERLTDALDPAFVYTFILVHHENARNPSAAVVAEHGHEYAFLVHIGMRCRVTMAAVDLADAPLADHGIVYPQRFATGAEGLAWLAEHPNSAGLIVKRGDGKTLLKVMTADNLEAESMDLGNSNPWINMLWVYMQNKPHYKITDYIARYLPGFAPNPAPTYVIHTVICTMRDILLSLYQATTRYYTDHKRFKMDTHIDGALPPIIRFHLAQLRRIQITRHTHAPINGRTIYHYLCLHTTMKNMRGLIGHFAEHATAGMPPRTAECFTTLDLLLKD